MNLSNIETFLCAVRHQSLSVAASALFISQPTVSARIRQLEEMTRQIKQAILRKPEWHGVLSSEHRSHAGRNMNQIGG